MKRLIALLLALTLAMTGAACAESAANPLEAAYLAAATLMVEGRYGEAAEAFAALSGYSDAPQMTAYCWGMSYMAAKDYARAAQAFAFLGDFKDSAMQAQLCRSRDMVQQADALLQAPAGLVDAQPLQEAATLLKAAQAGYDTYLWLPSVQAESAACTEKLAGADRRIKEIRDAIAAGQCSVISRDGWFGLFSPTGKTLLLQCDGVLACGKGLIVVRRGEGVSVLDWEGSTLAEADGWSEGVLERTVTEAGGARTLYGLADPESGSVMDCALERDLMSLYMARDDLRCSAIQGCGEQLLAIGSNGNVRIIRWDGTVVAEAGWWSDRMLQKNIVFADLNTGLVIPPAADMEVMWVENGVVAVRYGWEAAYQEAEEQGVTRNEWTEYANARARYGAYVPGIGQLLPCEYEDISLAGDGLILKQNGRYGYCTLTGETVLPLEYEEIDGAEDGLILKQNGKYSYCTLTGETVLPFEYEEIDEAGDGLILKQNGRYGYCALTGEEILPCVYDRIGYSSTCLHVERDGLKGLFDWTGKVIIPCEYEEIRSASRGWVVIRDGRQGLLSRMGEEILPCEYEEIRFGNRYAGCLLLRQNGRWGLFAPEVAFGLFVAESRMVLPCAYDEDEFYVPVKTELTRFGRAGEYVWYNAVGAELPVLAGVEDVAMTAGGLVAFPPVDGKMRIVGQNGQEFATLDVTGRKDATRMEWVYVDGQSLLEIEFGWNEHIWLDEAGQEVADPRPKEDSFGFGLVKTNNGLFNQDGVQLLTSQQVSRGTITPLAGGRVLEDETIPAEAILYQNYESAFGCTVRLVRADGTVLLDGYGVMWKGVIIRAWNRQLHFYDLNGQEIW